MDDLRFPAEWEPQAMMLVAWPTRLAVWGDALPAAYEEYVQLVRLASEAQHVTVICTENDREQVLRDLAARSVTVLVHPIDDGWIRDNGPLFCLRNGQLVAVDFDFNSWGNRYSPSDGDRSVGSSVADFLGVGRVPVPWVLEGGAISTNGQGTLLVSDQCVRHPNRNGLVTRQDAESKFRDYLGVERCIWLPNGLLEDLAFTDGHVDNIAVFISPDTVLVQTCSSDNPNYGRLRENLRTLIDAGVQIVECAKLPYTSMPDGGLQPAPYLNFVLTNSQVILPSVGSNDDPWALGFFSDLFPNRKVSFVGSSTLTFGGGGPHCVTMQVPSA